MRITTEQNLKTIEILGIKATFTETGKYALHYQVQTKRMHYTFCQ